MRNAGYADNAWTLLVANYMSPIPNGSGFRYSQSGYTRQSTGGCGFWNADANFANGTLLPRINQTVAEAITQSGLGQRPHPQPRRRLQRPAPVREHGRALRGEGPVQLDQRRRGDKTEWINTIRTVTATGDYYIQESLHPNYWGQKALRNCVRQAWNGGTPRSGTCVRGANGLNANGEPYMTLQ